MNVITLILNILGLILIIQWFIKLFRTRKNLPAGEKFYSLARFKDALLLAGIIMVPVFMVNFIIAQEYRLEVSSELSWSISAVLAFLISLIWFNYVRSIDIYEKEHLFPLIICFASAALVTLFVVSFLYIWAENNGFSLHESNSLVDNIFYSVVVVGGIEEFSKMIPVLFIMLFFKKAINEPYDFILYGSVSALGFAFIENIFYIQQSGLYNIGGRALYAIVAHMTFTSTVFYGWMLVRFKFTRLPAILVIPFFFALAMISHGFYDFWLFNFFAKDYSALTTAFYLITVHLWFTMKNNSLNVSNFYKEHILIDNDRLRSYLIFSLTGILMVGYLLVGLIDGRKFANQYIWFELLAYGYLIFYLAFGLSQYKIIRDTLHPLTIPFDFFVPKPRRHKEK